MTAGLSSGPVGEYVRKTVSWEGPLKNLELADQTAERIEKALDLLPDEVMQGILSGESKIFIRVVPDAGFPVGMATRSEGKARKPQYIISIRDEHLKLDEDLFTASLLREFGHVVAKRPHDSQWPSGRAERAAFRERLEARADAMVWRWGLRHYSMRFLMATYPEHHLERILEEISKALLELEDEMGE